ncbi:Lysine-specific demethylase 6A [Ceratobasidium sp. 428]|nr:Lysine-specific demethylase 6A [Ceratobasidium sp. 428]
MTMLRPELSRFRRVVIHRVVEHFQRVLSLQRENGNVRSTLGHCFLKQDDLQNAYSAYQQALYYLPNLKLEDPKLCIGVLYYNINQFRDALDAYSRAIRINPYISEVWFDLGSLYESCNNQISDAIDAYARTDELDPGNPHITQRLNLLRNVQANGGNLPAAPGPQDIHPTA